MQGDKDTALSLTPVTAMDFRLFCDTKRSYIGPICYSESKFDYLNRSAHKWTGNVRDTFEYWYSRFPDEKKRDLRSRFRSGDGQMLGASLEVVTHAILEAIAVDVKVEPQLAGGRPDFQAAYQESTFAVECTVAQESDIIARSTQRENRVKDLVNSIDSGGFVLYYQLLESSQKQLPTKKLRRKLGRALKKKADAYSSIELSYLVVAGSATNIDGDDEELFEALFGFEGRRSDGLWGSPDRPRNRQVSAVLFTPWENPWVFCRQLQIMTCPSDRYFETVEEAVTANDIEYFEQSAWRLVHNPWAQAPLPRGQFSFAEEFYVDSDELVGIKPETTLNQILKLPDHWPGYPLESEKDAWRASVATT